MPDSNITLRSIKGSPLSHSELDRNFREYFYSASVSGSEVRLYRSQSANQFETINLSEPKGPQYALQLKQGTAESGASINFTGSKSLTYDFSSSRLTVTGSSFFQGDMTVDGAVIANTFISDTVIEGISTGSTSFGKDKGTDKHIRTGSMYLDGDFDTTGRISSPQPITASVHYSNLISLPTLVSGSEQITVQSTTGFTSLQSNISSSFAVSSSAHTQRQSISSSAHTQRQSISSSAATALRAEYVAGDSTLSSSIHGAYLKNTSDTFTGDLSIVGTLTATTYVVSSSVTHLTTSFSSGSTQFGDTADDTHTFTGSVNIDGATTITGNTNILGALTASAIQATISGSIDQADNATSASYVLATNIDGTVANSTSSSFASTSSFATTASTVNFNGGLTTTSDVQFDSFGVGVAATGTAGEIVATGDITAYYSSDERLKDNITPLSNALDKINQIGGYEFDWNSDSSHSGHDVGVIAQEIEKVLPEVVVDRDTGYKAVRYDKIVALLIQAVKEQQLQIDELKSKL